MVVALPVWSASPLTVWNRNYRVPTVNNAGLESSDWVMSTLILGPSDFIQFIQLQREMVYLMFARVPSKHLPIYPLLSTFNSPSVHPSIPPSTHPTHLPIHQFFYSVNHLTITPTYLPPTFFYFLWLPRADYGLFIYEVSWSNTTTRHSR
jgi:hypothetical protein